MKTTPDERESAAFDPPLRRALLRVYRVPCRPGPNPELPPDSGDVWEREWVGELIAPIDAEDPRPRAHLERRGWLTGEAP